MAILENADNQIEPNRKVAMGVVHLIRLTLLKMDLMRDQQTINASG